MCFISKIPSANILAQRIISSADKLFFIPRRIGGSITDICEWCLICIVLTVTLSSYPSCLEDSKHVVYFYGAHPSNLRYNTINWHFWLVQYHGQDNLLGPCSSSDTHLICHSDNSKAYTKCWKLLPFCCFVNLTHLDTYTGSLWFCHN